MEKLKKNIIFETKRAWQCCMHQACVLAKHCAFEKLGSSAAADLKNMAAGTDSSMKNMGQCIHETEKDSAFRTPQTAAAADPQSAWLEKLWL